MRFTSVLLLLMGLAVAPVWAQDDGSLRPVDPGLSEPAPPATPAEGCLSPGDIRAAIDEQRVLPLSEITASLRARTGRAELVGARLCLHEGKLAYIITFVDHSGRVSRYTVEAAVGHVLRTR